MTSSGGDDARRWRENRSRRCRSTQVPLIDNSFGFTSAVEAAIPMIEAANTEAEACPNGIGIVKLMGRHSGFIALHATLASGDVDLCLVPESSFEIEGIMDHLEAKLRENENAQLS